MRRASGILLHITSLPSAFGIGDLGPESYKFASLLFRLKQHYWSVLPLSPTGLEGANSPYQTSSVCAGNPLIISPEKLVEKGLLPQEYLKSACVRPTNKIHFARAYAAKEQMLERAYSNFKQSQRVNCLDSYFSTFCQENSAWLDDYALYVALRKKTTMPWYSWPAPLRVRDGTALKQKEFTLKQEIEKEKFIQWLFFSQLTSLRSFCQANQVQIIGDMPFYVNYDSVDVWVHQDLFSLSTKGKPRFVGGVPPDYFSASGQLWGNPTYNWQNLEETGFQWWINRIRHSLKFYDKLRLDHFRGFIAYWQVSASAKTAKNGRWIQTPSKEFFKAIVKAFPTLPFIAEDLGYIDQPVKDAISNLGIPGMRVLLFGFDEVQDNPHYPKNLTENSVVYTGTHDTNTVKGWFLNESSSKEKKNLFDLIGRKIGADRISFELIKLALSSKADLSILPIQDVLGLDSNARMNNPGSSRGNWEWKMTNKQLETPDLSKLSDLIVRTQRS